MLLACLDSPHGLSDATVAKEMNRHRSSDRAKTARRQPSRVVTGVAISRRIRTFYYTYILQTDAKRDCYERVSNSLHAAQGPMPQFAAHAPPSTRPTLQTCSTCIARETHKATQRAAAVALGCSGDVEVVDRKLAATQSAREARHTVVRGAQHVRLGGLFTRERPVDWANAQQRVALMQCGAVVAVAGWENAYRYRQLAREAVALTRVGQHTSAADCFCQHHLPLAAHRVCTRDLRPHRATVGNKNIIGGIQHVSKSRCGD